MKHITYRLIGITALLLLVLTAFSPSFQKVGGHNQRDPLDAQSTTGPHPISAIAGAEGLNYVPSVFSISVSNMPAYIWRYGCGPTSAGMILGYWDRFWDSKGYDWIIRGSAATETTAVQQAIASSLGDRNHVTDYALPIDNADTGLLLDRSEPGRGNTHVWNSLADFMHTSFSSFDNFYGWSWFSDIPVAYKGYLATVNPGNFVVTTKNVYLADGTLTWDTYKNEIASGRPVLLLVDSNRDGQTDHFIPAFGYDTVNNVNMYEAYNTWDISPHWYVWEGMNTARAYGVYGGTLLDIEPVPPTETPAPALTDTIPIQETLTLTPPVIFHPTLTPTHAITGTKTFLPLITSTPTQASTPPPGVVIIDAGSLEKVVDALKWFAYAGGALLFVSWLLDHIAAFRAIKSKRVKWVINFGLSTVLAYAVHLLIVYVPSSFWATIDPWFTIILGYFGIYTLQQLVHKVTKPNQEKKEQ